MKRYFAVCGAFVRCVLPCFLIVLLGLLGVQGWCFYQASAHPSVLEDPMMNEVVRSLPYILSRSIHLNMMPVILAAVLLLCSSSKNTKLTDTLDRLPISKNGVLICQAICFTLCFLTAYFALSALITGMAALYAAAHAGPQSVVQEFFANSFLRNFIPIFEPWKFAANLAIHFMLGTTLACNSECMRRGKTPVSGLFAFLILLIFYPKTDEGFGLGLVGMLLALLYACSEVGTARDEP